MLECKCGVDIHAHIVPKTFPRYLPMPDLPGWPAMEPAHQCHRHVMIDGKAYRTVSDRCWDVDLRLADMAEMGINLQVISPMPELFSYWLAKAPAVALLRYINDVMAEMVAASGGKLKALGAVPLQDTDLAIAELHRVCQDLGFAGVEIGSNINGRPIGAAEFEPFFAAAAALGAAVFVHAVRPAGMDRVIGPPQLQQALGYPTDIGLAAVSVVTGNLITRHPNLRIAFSHGGGTFGLLLPRLQQAFEVFQPVRDTMQTDPATQARKLYYDSLVFDTATLRHLVDVFGAGQIMIGTDYPFAFRDKSPNTRICNAITDLEITRQLLYKNAAKFLGLQEPTQ